MKQYKYRPIRFYITAFILTWLFWIAAILVEDAAFQTVLMFFGLISPAVTAIITVFTSKSPELKKDFKRKILGFYKLKPLNLLVALIVFACIVCASILLSTLFGQSLGHLRLRVGAVASAAVLDPGYLSLRAARARHRLYAELPRVGRADGLYYDMGIR